MATLSESLALHLLELPSFSYFHFISYLKRFGRSLLVKACCRFSFLLLCGILWLHLVVNHPFATTCYCPFCGRELILIAQMSFQRTACWLVCQFDLSYLTGFYFVVAYHAKFKCCNCAVMGSHTFSCPFVGASTTSMLPMSCGNHGKKF